MATLALGALGTLVGGPVGGAIGALAGRQIDSSIISSGTREGARLKDLTVTTSSYGTPLAKHYGRMRTAGTIIWATDLNEDRETSGGGKGKPATTSFNYSTSFAVALSSRPIIGLGRIWADGTLLRGAAGDLKVGGTMRLHHGHRDQPLDPLIAASEGAKCPAFRGLAYAVFENLQLEDFGNRIPALSFEVIADNGFSLSDIVEPLVDTADISVGLDDLAGFSYEGGSLSGLIDTIGDLYVINVQCGSDGISLQSVAESGEVQLRLPDAVPSGDKGEFGLTNGVSEERKAGAGRRIDAVRYYDTMRDYQTGVQRSQGRANLAGGQTLQFPGAMGPDSARFLINRAASQIWRKRETMFWRVAELDSRFIPGTVVSAPGTAGTWMISSWEWRERGVDLVLERAPLPSKRTISGDSGSPVLPLDTLPAPTQLHVFELPWDGLGSADGSQIFAALGSDTQSWSGATLFSSDSGPLTAIGPSGRSQAVMGAIVAPLEASTATRLEPASFFDVELISPAMGFISADISALASGQNRLVVGDEIVQFSDATPLSERVWRLKGLLRGRGASEATAAKGHDSGAPVILIDNSLVAIDQDQLPLSPTAMVAAIGRGDEEPIMASISNRGAGLRPLVPVHPRTQLTAESGLHLCWTRRARGAWSWLNSVETPLIEEVESYRVGIGDVEAPSSVWEVGEPEMTISAEEINAHSGEQVWVQQVGRESVSLPLQLVLLP